MTHAKLRPRHAANPRDNPHLIKRWIVITPDMQTPVDLRVYTAQHLAKRSAVYADLFTDICSGSGKAGYAKETPYDQQTAAALRAFDAAGVQFWRGHTRQFDLSIPDALRALCAAMGIETYRIIN